MRTSQYLGEKENQPYLIGVNTDSGNSVGHFCGIGNLSDLPAKIDRILNKDFDAKLLPKLKLSLKKSGKEAYFINDVFFGEKFLGRMTKYKLVTENEQPGKIYKSSGILFSTRFSITSIRLHRLDLQLQRYELQ